MEKTSVVTSTSDKINAPSRGLFWIRKAFSLLVIYHLAAVLIAPNLNHYVADRLKPYFMPYWQLLEFGSQWNFFAPEPGPAPIFLKYEVYGKSGELLIADQMPHYPDDFFFRDRQIRRLNIVRYLLRNDEKIYSLFVPWICRTYPNADFIKLKKFMMKLPSVMEIQKNERSFADLRDAQEWNLSDVSCEGRAE